MHLHHFKGQRPDDIPAQAADLGTMGKTNVEGCKPDT